MPWSAFPVADRHCMSAPDSGCLAKAGIQLSVDPIPDTFGNAPGAKGDIGMFKTEAIFNDCKLLFVWSLLPSPSNPIAPDPRISLHP